MTLLKKICVRNLILRYKNAFNFFFKLIDFVTDFPTFLIEKNKISNLLSPLHWAARKGHKEIVELLISRGRVTQD